MIIKLFDIEIKITLSTRRSRVLKDMQEIGNLRTIKNYKDRYGCGLNEAWQYIKKIEAEEKSNV